jgi:hypothetical protein
VARGEMRKRKRPNSKRQTWGGQTSQIAPMIGRGFSARSHKTTPRPRRYSCFLLLTPCFFVRHQTQSTPRPQSTTETGGGGRKYGGGGTVGDARRGERQRTQCPACVRGRARGATAQRQGRIRKQVRRLALSIKSGDGALQTLVAQRLFEPFIAHKRHATWTL